MANTNKILHSLLYIASQFPSKTVNAMKAYKLMWLADRLHLRKYGRTITGDKYFALPNGVVPTDAKHIVDGKNTVLQSDFISSDFIEIAPNKSFTALKDFEPKFFSKSDIDALGEVINKFGDLSPEELSELSHKYPEWKAYEESILNENRRDAYEIDMNLFFENRENEDSELFSQSEFQLSYSKNLFNRKF